MNTPRVVIPAIETVKVVLVDGWMDLKTAAKYLGKNPEKVRQAAQLWAATQGKSGLAHGRDGNRYKFKREECDQWLRGQALDA